VLLIVGAVVVGVAVGLLMGGSVRELAEVQFRWWGLAILGLALQLVPVPSRPGQLDHWLATGLLIASYVALLVFVAANLRYVGFWVVAAGFALNVLVISLNGGMPVGDHALRVAYGSGYPATLRELVAGGGAKHHLERPGDVLTPLADVIPVGKPVGNVFSFGDMLALAGVAWVMAEAARGRPGRHRAGRAGQAVVSPERSGRGERPGGPAPAGLGEATSRPARTRPPDP
jgi:hypothetical protein